jgi:hypothetical protein
MKDEINRFDCPDKIHPERNKILIKLQKLRADVKDKQDNMTEEASNFAFKGMWGGKASLEFETTRIDMIDAQAKAGAFGTVVKMLDELIAGI